MDIKQTDKMSFRMKMILLVTIITVIYGFSSFVNLLNDIFFDSYRNVTTKLEIPFNEPFQGLAQSDNTSATLINNYYYVVSDNVLASYQGNGVLRWRRQLTSEAISLLPFGDQLVLIEKNRGDLALLDYNNINLAQIKDNGPIDKVSIYKNQLIAVSQHRNNSILVFNNQLKLQKTIILPEGDLISFSFSKSQPRLLVYMTKLEGKQIRSFIYHYDEALNLIATNDLNDTVVYSYLYEDGLITIGEDWMKHIVSDSENPRAWKNETIRLEDYKDSIELVSYSDQAIGIFSLLQKGEHQGNYRLALYDTQLRLIDEMILQDTYRDLLLSNQYIALVSDQRIDFYNYKMEFLCDQILLPDVIELFWVSATEFAVKYKERLVIFEIN